MEMEMRDGAGADPAVYFPLPITIDTYIHTS
jgi:hypothetical protein